MNETDWEQLLHTLDYHHRKWYRQIDGRWYQISWAEAHDLIAAANLNEEIDKIMKKFAYRDTEAHARPKDQKGGSQLMLI